MTAGSTADGCPPRTKQQVAALTMAVTRSRASAHAAVGARDLAEIRAGPDSATRLMRRGLDGVR